MRGFDTFGWLRHFLLMAVVVAEGVRGATLRNITLALPIGTTDHGTPGLVCTPTKGIDIITFYLLNYVAHAATVLMKPGEPSLDFAATVFGCLLFPAMGLFRGIEAILSGSVFAKDHLSRAARSGALCMLVRSPDWRPMNDDEITNVVLKRAEPAPAEDASFNPPTEKATKEVHVVTYQPPWILSKFGCPIYVHRQIIHGRFTLPDGYRFVILPPHARFAASTAATRIEIAATFNFVKAIVALAQTLYAFSTLYQSRGDQIQQFGYAAFGLTVAPYAVMSIVNLLGNLCRPDYASLYMVESSIMDEARTRGGDFQGAVGRIEEEAPPSICSCSVVGADDVDSVRFNNYDSEHRTTALDTSAPGHCPETTASSSASGDEKSLESPLSPTPTTTAYVRTSNTPRSYRVKALPENMDYSTTDKEDILLVPSANPLKYPPPSPEDPSARFRIDSIELCKLSTKCRKHLTWHVSFLPRVYRPRKPRLWRLFIYLATLVIALIPLAITAGLSRFSLGSYASKDAGNWRVYTMQWLAFGVVFGIWWVFDGESKDAMAKPVGAIGPLGRALLYIAGGSSAVGGFIVVGQMMSKYGVCQDVTH